EGSGKAIELANLAASNREFSGEPHRTNVERICFFHDPRFEDRQFRIRIHIIDRPQQLTFGEVKTRRAVAADRNTEKSGAAAFSLGLPNGVKNTGTNPFQISVRARALDLHGQTVLRAHVLAPATFENKPDVNIGIACLFPMKHGTAGSKVVAGVGAVDAV